MSSDNHEHKLSRKERRKLLKTRPEVHALESSAPVHKQKKGFLGTLDNLYYHHYKPLLLVPFIMLILAFIIIGITFITTGDFVKRGISLKGGIEVTITPDMAPLAKVDLVLLQKILQENFPDVGVKVREQTDFGERTGITFEAPFEQQEDIAKFLTVIAHQFPTLTEEILRNNLSTIGSSLSQDFFRTALIALFIAFLFMACVVFLSFRTLAPSAAVILAAFSDIVVTLAIFNLFGFELSTAGVAAFLMLIGYSVDTDILLSTRVLKRKEGTVYERILKAMKTGLGMTLTTLAAVIVGLFFASSPELKQIFTIILIGLFVDIINTWLQNAGILRYYMERKGVQ